MKQTIILFTGVILFYIIFSNIVVASNIIPEDALRVRVIPNSNNAADQAIKAEVADLVKTNMYNLLKNVSGVDRARKIINNNLSAMKSDIIDLFSKKEYNKSFDINFGLNYFPEKEYKGIKYDEGYYESLVVTIGEGKGDNWWCVLFPPLCLIEAEENTNVEYTSIVKELIKRYM